MKNKRISCVLRQNMHILRCPVCSRKMSLHEDQLKCTFGHSFDLSSNGYVNLLNHSASTDYNKQLFQSRKNITQNGFFDLLKSAIADKIYRRTEINPGTNVNPGTDINSNTNMNPGKDINPVSAAADLTVLDAGCGEGTLFSRILEQIKERFSCINSIGIDISKDGIRLAGKCYPDTLWMVADLADLPIADNSTDIILNVLSPANYHQFKRILKKNGLLIKVIPGNGYLQELRELFLKESNCLNYSNRNVISLFGKHFRSAECSHIVETISLDEENAIDLMNMTPLLWHIEENEKEKIFSINKVTMDLHILTGHISQK